MSRDAFTLKGGLVYLRLFRLGRLPPALYSAEILAEQGFPVVAIEFGNIVEETPFVEGKIPRIRISAPFARLFPTRLRVPIIWVIVLVKLIFRFRNEGKPRFIVAHGLQEQIMAWCLSRVFQIPYAVHVHEVYDARDLGLIPKLFFLFEGRALRDAAFTIFPEITRSEIYHYRYRLTNRSFLAFNCPRIRTVERNKADFLKKHSLPENAFVLIYIGGIGDSNYLGELVKAIGSVPNVYLLLAGWSDVEFMNELKSIAQKNGSSERIRFLGALGEEKWEVLDNSDLSWVVYKPTVMRLRYLVTASNKLMESLSSGVPVIILDTPEARFELKDFPVCFFLSHPTTDAIAGLLSEACANQSFREKARSASLRAHQEHLNYEAQFEQVSRYLRQWFRDALPTDRNEKLPSLREG